MKTHYVINIITFRVDTSNTICDYLAISRTLLATRNEVAGSLKMRFLPDAGRPEQVLWGVVKLNGELGNSFAVKILDK